MANQEIRIVVTAPTFGSPFHISMIENFKKLFKPEEMVLRSVTGESDIQRERLRLALEQTRPIALIAMDIRPDPDIISIYRAAKVPIVLLDEEAAGVSSIAIDNMKGGHIAGTYLISKGKKKLAIVSGRTKVKGGFNAEQRLKGFQQALREKNLFIPQGGMVEVMQYSREDGLEVMPNLLTLGVDAVFCAAGDNCAQGLLSVARDRGVRIPEDVAIVGFDDLLIAQLSTPALTTIRQPLKEMAQAAYTMVMLQRDEILNNPQKMLFQPELVIRKSA
ncbi:MAG: LacI family transcriptional regulator [Ignavibacteriae bacterium]|nr:MAG: LacI family transcriptional regulator [Ignavibacteriota bacterium]